jgi:hypothetical protein
MCHVSCVTMREVTLREGATCRTCMQSSGAHPARHPAPAPGIHPLRHTSTQTYILRQTSTQTYIYTDIHRQGGAEVTGATGAV